MSLPNDLQNVIEFRMIFFKVENPNSIFFLINNFFTHKLGIIRASPMIPWICPVTQHVSHWSFQFPPLFQFPNKPHPYSEQPWNGKLLIANKPPAPIIMIDQSDQKKQRNNTTYVVLSQSSSRALGKCAFFSWHKSLSNGPIR